MADNITEQRGTTAVLDRPFTPKQQEALRELRAKVAQVQLKQPPGKPRPFTPTSETDQLAKPRRVKDLKHPDDIVMSETPSGWIVQGAGGAQRVIPKS